MAHILKFEDFCKSRFNESREYDRPTRRSYRRLYENENADAVFAKHKGDELTKTDAEDAYKIAVEMLGKENVKSIYGTEEEFAERYDAAQESAEKNGKYKRGAMPVINNSNFKGFGGGKDDKDSAPRKEELEKVLDEKDVDKKIKDAVLSNQVVAFKFLVGNGFIDIDGEDKDIAKKTQQDLFKDDALAQEWLSSGGGPKDTKDVVKGDYEYISVEDLKPIQEQIFVAKALKMSAGAEGDKGKLNWLLKADEKSPLVIVSSDNYILDGHHRWLGAYLIDPEAKMRCVKIDMDCKDLLALTNKFTGAIGNKPNVTA